MTQTVNKSKATSISIVNPNSAGIDIGGSSHFVAVPEGRSKESVREFECFTCEINSMSRWLKECNIDTVVMESTGTYWIPVFEMLDREGFEVMLVDAHQVKNVRGRKSDVIDSQWLQQLHAHGLLSAAFRPEDKIVELRSFVRQRSMLIESAAMHIQHMQKALTQMNLQLNNVVSDITGVTGMAIIRLLLQGETDPVKLAKLRDPRCRSSEEKIQKSLEGNLREDHLFALKQAVDAYDFYVDKVKECDEAIKKKVHHLSPLPDTTLPKKRKLKKYEYSFDVRSHLNGMVGTDLTTIPGIDASTALKLISEIGIDIGRWPSAKHFCAWLGLCPGTRISGGRILRSKTQASTNKAGVTLRMAANSLYRSSNYFGSYLRKMKARMAPAQAVTALAHKMARTIYSMMKNKEDFQELGPDHIDRQNIKKTRKFLEKRAAQLGFTLVETSPDPIPNPSPS